MAQLTDEEGSREVVRFAIRHEQRVQFANQLMLDIVKVSVFMVL
jgi:hypothetical protein